MTTQVESGRQTGSSPERVKGKVRVETDKGWLRLRFTYQGKRHTFALGLPDTKANRTVAEQRALQIELDIQAHHFDSTLNQYKPQKQVEQQKGQAQAVVTLFTQFLDHKVKEVTPKTMEKYKATLRYVEEFFLNETGETLTGEDVERFVASQSGKGLSASQVKRRIEELKACWVWHQLEPNPWNAVIKQVKVPPKQKPKPFTKAEIDTIIQAFNNDRYYSAYTDLVKFLFWTGCRTGEALGLRWQHLSDNCSRVFRFLCKPLDCQ